MKNPWGEDTPWPKQVNFFTYLRGCLRKAWSNNPIKLQVLKSKRKQIVNPNPKGKKPMVWGFDCEMCGKTFPISEGQVDHIHPAGTLKEKEDIQGFVERLLFVTEDDLRLVCKGCNNALAMSDKTKRSYEECLVDKQAIAIQKVKGGDVKWLEARDVPPGKNAKIRKQQIIDKLKEETSGEPN